MKQENKLTVSFIVQTCKGRESYVDYLKSKIPDLIVNYDNFDKGGEYPSAWLNYLRGLELAGCEATVQMDDDIILCYDFVSKIKKEIQKHPDSIIQFFSMRKDDITIGSRWVYGRTFMMNQCYYLPKGIAKEILDFIKEYETRADKSFNIDETVPIDCLIALFLKSKKLKYWNVVPNLVDHRIGVSKINKRRSSKRQSLTFEYGEDI